MRSLYPSLFVISAIFGTPMASIAADGVAATAGDAEAGAALYQKQCRQCHGPTAKGMASYPKLRGKTSDYLVDRLERYRKGERFGPNTPLMAPRAKVLSDEDILNISVFIVSIDKE